MQRRLLSFLTLAAFAALCADPTVADQTAGSKADAPKTVAAAKSPSAAAPAAEEYHGREVMDPSKFYGLAAVGYASAKAAPEIMSKLFCYCGCDSTDNHSHLIDCFTSPHGVDCHICQEEAIMALKLHRQGVPMAEIQKQIDTEFAHHYPFTEETATYKKYKASRLWIPEGTVKTATGTSDAPHTDPAGPSPPGADKDTSSGTKSATTLKVKPGYHVGQCCGGGEKEHK